MNARFVLMQRSLEIPDVEKLKRAFRSVRCLTASDARPLANDAYGILVKNLVVDEAMTLQRALHDEGIETAVVLESDLPHLPPVKFVRRMDCLEDALMVYDPIGRPFPVCWDDVMLIAAGNVRQFELREVEAAPRSHLDILGTDFGLSPADDFGREVRVREEQAFHSILEIVLTQGAMRYQVRSDKFLFHYLGERRRGELVENFALLVQDVMKFAPRALVNRGAYLLRENTLTDLEYPSRNAFYEEITWILWQAKSRGD